MSKNPNDLFKAIIKKDIIKVIKLNKEKDIETGLYNYQYHYSDDHMCAVEVFKVLALISIEDEDNSSDKSDFYAFKFSFSNKNKDKLEIVKLLIRPKKVIDEIAQSKAYFKGDIVELAKMDTLFEEFRSLMQIIKNLFAKDGIINLLNGFTVNKLEKIMHKHKQKSFMQAVKSFLWEEETTPLPTKFDLDEPLKLVSFKSFSKDEDSNKYAECSNYYQVPTQYFQFLLLTEISKIKSKEIQNLLDIINNNITTLQNREKYEPIVDSIIFEDSSNNVITLEKHLYKSSSLHKICIKDQNGFRDYTKISQDSIADSNLDEMSSKLGCVIELTES